MVQVFIETEEVLASLNNMKGRYEDAIAKGFAEAGRLVVDLFRRDWLSGRSAGDLGLNIRTGRLHASLDSRSMVQGPHLTSDVFNQGADYWYFHQNPEGGRHKFLYLKEAFAEDGAKIYEGQVEQALRMVS